MPAARPPCGPPWGLGRSTARPHGYPDHGWQAWVSTAVIVLVVYLAVSLVRWDLGYFWPMWVIGPWGAVLLSQAVTGRGVRSGAHG